MGEGVVDVVVLGTRRRPTAELAEQPELLEVPDVRVVPAERRHEQRHLPHEFVLANGCRQLLGTGSRLLVLCGDELRLARARHSQS